MCAGPGYGLADPAADVQLFETTPENVLMHLKNILATVSWTSRNC
jgi:hypothetical protein